MTNDYCQMNNLATDLHGLSHMLKTKKKTLTAETQRAQKSKNYFLTGGHVRLWRELTG
jgi:hypothetical protein